MLISLYSTSATVARARHDDSTSNLGRHCRYCTAVPNAQAAGQLTMPMFAAGSTYSEIKLRFLIVKWCACNSRPMVIVKDEAYVEQLKMFNQGVVIPSDTTVSRDIKRVFDVAKTYVKEYIAQVPGKKHQTMDGWSSPNVLSVLGNTLTFLVGDEIKTITLDCYRCVFHLDSLSNLSHSLLWQVNESSYWDLSC